MSASVLACARDFSSGESCGEICGASGFVGSGSGSLLAEVWRTAGGRAGELREAKYCGANCGRAVDATLGGVVSISRIGMDGGCVTPLCENFALTGCFGQPPNPITANTGINRKPK